MSLAVLSRADLDERLKVEIARLWLEIWPKDSFTSPEDYAQHVFDTEGEDARVQVSDSDRYHLVSESGVIQAVCLSFLREIEFVETGDRMTVLGLAGVCSRPTVRGKGHGRAIVASAFERIGTEVDCGLFQTGVPAFYTKLGAQLIENRFVNSLSDADPEANPWWDECVMAIGDLGKWQCGRVDLLGAGY